MRNPRNRYSYCQERAGRFVQQLRHEKFLAGFAQTVMRKWRRPSFFVVCGWNRRVEPAKTD
jgi:hypothetical protein